MTPDEARALHVRSLALSREGLLDDAVSGLERALAVLDVDDTPRCELVRLYRQGADAAALAGDLDTAAGWRKRAIQCEAEEWRKGGVEREGT
jgi:hypothetical protein